MKTKIIIVIPALVILLLTTIVFTQIFFPLYCKVSSIKISFAKKYDDSMAFDNIKNGIAKNYSSDSYEYLNKNVFLKDIKNYCFVRYDIDLYSTSLKPLGNIGDSIIVTEKYSKNFFVRVKECFYRRVKAFKNDKDYCTVLVDVEGLTDEEIKSMVKDVQLKIFWDGLISKDNSKKINIPANVDIVFEK